MLDLLNPEQDLINGLNNHQCGGIPPIPEGLTQNDRWLAASSLQKSIRRGMIKESLYAAHVLKSFSPTHLWNRLAVIALEDVGLANINLAAQVLWCSGKVTWRKKSRGDGFILSYLIHQLCYSNGCRALDDALYCAEYHPLFSHQRMIYSGMTEDELYSLFHDESLDVAERILICRYLCGSRYRSEVLELQKRDPSIIFNLAHSIGAPPHVIDILNLSKGQEYFTCILPCIMQMEQSKSCRIVNYIDTQFRMVGAYPDFAYDRHTRPGKMAFRRFLKLSPDVLGFITKHCPEADPVNLVGWAVFILESQNLNKRMVYNGSECLRELAAQSWLHSGGMGIEIQEEFLMLMKTSFARMYNARG